MPLLYPPRARRKRAKKPASRAHPPIQLDGAPFAPAGLPRFLVPRERWQKLPDWIALEAERGRGNKFEALHDDLLFRIDASGGTCACMLPFEPRLPRGRGAAIVCPGGNYEFLAPHEGAPVARWLAESLGVRAYVLRYRLLPKHCLHEMQTDLSAAVATARRECGGGPVVALGFSAGGHLVASTSSLEGHGRPDAQVLVYPCTEPRPWLVHEEAGFWRARVESEQVRSLVAGHERLKAGADFVPPPPSFVVASTADSVCPPETETCPYVEAARGAGVEVCYMKGDYGEHGFGLKRVWTRPLAAWLEKKGIGKARGWPGKPAASEAPLAAREAPCLNESGVGSRAARPAATM